MMYKLSFYGVQWLQTAYVMHYISVRAIAALLSALCVSWVCGDWFIGTSQRFFRSKARPLTPERHQELKDNMPTMGGLFILGNVVVNALLWCDLSDIHVWIVLVSMLLFGAIGAWDDWCKIHYKQGVSARTKAGLQVFAAFIVVLWWLCATGWPTTIVFPFFKYMQPDIGLFFVLWAMFILVGTSNAVNLTDGLDGLAIGSLIPTFATFALVCYCAGHWLIARYLWIPFAGTAELAIVAASLVGASLGFLWYNTYPAQIFMGDVGSLGLGAALATMALLAKQEMLLVIAGGLFVVETLSVIVQVASFKLWGKRIFKMAPLHHHFELLGWQESKITVRFIIISLVLCLLALVTLKLR